MQASTGQCRREFRLARGAIRTQRHGPKPTRYWSARPLRAVAVDDLTEKASELGVSFSPLHEDLGADVTGMDLSGGVSDAEGALVKKALDRYLLLRFRNQTLEPADEAKFLLHLPHDEESIKNMTAKHIFEGRLPDHPWISAIALNMDLEDHYGVTKKGLNGLGPFFRSIHAWHMDNNHTECSPKYSYMYMKIVPPENPATLFASSVKAYDLLSDEQKRVADKLRMRLYDSKGQMGMMSAEDSEFILSESGVRFADPAFREAQAKRALDEGESPWRDYLMPLVIEEKGTGVRSFHITPFRTHSFEGMTLEESNEYMERVLLPVTSKPWAADWQPDDVVVWKNRQVFHALPPPSTYSGPRLFHSVFLPSNDPVVPVQN